MLPKIRFIISPFIFITVMNPFLECKAQNTKMITGQYKAKNFWLSIFDDNIFLIGAPHSILFGSVEVDGNKITLTVHKPKHKFALYGRKVSTRLHGNTIMFDHFDEGEGLVNLLENNDPPKTMQRVFNLGAECIKRPNLYDNTNDCKEIYFSEENTSELYKFKLPKDFRDFVAFRLKDDSNRKPIIGEVSEDFQITINGEKIFKIPIEQEVLDWKETIITMFQNEFPEEKFFHCNPVYNTSFWEETIDINQYEEIGKAGEGIFKRKQIGQDYSVLTDKDRLKYDFNDPTIIYQYERIEPEIIPKASYSVDNQSIFTFVCRDK